MNKTWKWLLMAALVLSLSMIVTSCKDDNDTDGRTPEEIAQDPYEKESEAADALYRLVSQLSICDSLPNDWKTATFEPKAGKVLDASQPRVRTIAVNNAAEAVARYNSLTGKDLSATTTTDTYKVEGVGTLTLNVGGAGTIATIDVDVKQMPQLAQLRLVSAADMGENGHFRGEPYYNFGDVVRDEDGCYWICVRPAYSPNGKEDTHWMSFQLIDKNIKTYTKKGCEQQVYPVDLGVQKEKMQYLAQLMAILANPDDYEEAAGEGNYFGGIGLGGLQEAAMPVDSLVRQAKLWERNKVWEKIMPVGIEKNENGVKDFKDRFQEDVTFIYEKGSVSGSNLTIRTVQYTGAGKFYRNEPDYEKVVVDLKTISFLITNRYTANGTCGDENYPVPDAFVVRYKNGYQLSSNWVFSPSATDSIPGVTTVHRFNACQDIQFADMKSYTSKQARPKMIMAKNGKFYKSEAACAADHTEPVALVVYVGDSVEASGNYRGLAMSYTQEAAGEWDKEAQRDNVCIENTSEDKQTWEKQNDGVSRTEKLYKDGHSHPAAKAAWEYEVKGFDPAAYGFSPWFLPTAGQAIMAVRGLGGKAEYNITKKKWDCTINTKLAEDLDDVGIDSFDVEFDCWTSTEFGVLQAVYFQYRGAYDFSIGTYLRDFEFEVRPFIAF